ncbi:hypothetical protein [Microbulbifer sp. SAOS-129_SWC]|uniref:hypothetical protein n=1 Tax=Microbulbifer sp. SAOS-129_SWC TaxID=3145235 RepID=UPI0032168936
MEYRKIINVWVDKKIQFKNLYSITEKRKTAKSKSVINRLLFFAFWCCVSVNAAAVTATANGSDGSIFVDWSGSYSLVHLAEYKNGVFQRTITPSGIISSYKVTNRSEGIWKYSVSGEPTSIGGGGGCIPNCPFAFWERLKKNPLFFLASSAYAGEYIGDAEVEMLKRPGVPGSISLATTDKDGSYTISWGLRPGL